MQKSTLYTMIATAAFALSAAGAVPEHFQPRAKELLADSIELEQNAYDLNVVYFVGNDMEPTADYERRISELLLYLQQYYGKEMARNGYGKHSFGLQLKENGKIDKTCITCGNCAVLLRAGRCAGCVIHDREVYKL